MKKIYNDDKSTLCGLTFDSMCTMIGGFGVCGIPKNLIAALRNSGAQNIAAIFKNASLDRFGLGQLLKTKQIIKIISFYLDYSTKVAEQIRSLIQGYSGIQNEYTNRVVDGRAIP